MYTSETQSAYDEVPWGREKLNENKSMMDERINLLFVSTFRLETSTETSDAINNPGETRRQSFLRLSKFDTFRRSNFRYFELGQRPVEKILFQPKTFSKRRAVNSSSTNSWLFRRHWRR